MVAPAVVVLDLPVVAMPAVLMDVLDMDVLHMDVRHMQQELHATLATQDLLEFCSLFQAQSHRLLLLQFQQR
jgi:hypothetical protein